MSAQHVDAFAGKEDEGLIAIDRIEETVQDIMRRNGYSAERAAEEMSIFAHGHSHLFLHSKASQAVVDKIAAMVEDIIQETGLRRSEINALIQMINDTDFGDD